MTVDALPLPHASSASSRRWIESPLFDAAFFALPGLTTLPLLSLALVDGRFGVFFLALAVPHYLSTLSFFFWDENRERHRARAVAFFAGPAIIALAVTALMLTGLPMPVMVVMFVWNTYHVARQNCGILSIYRHRGGVFDQRERNAANAAIVATSFFLAFWNIDTFEPLLGIPSTWMSSLRDFRYVLGAIALVTLARLAWRLIKRSAAPSMPEVLFLAISLTFFHPYLWLRTSTAATAVLLVPHYVQYLGIVWLIHRRRARSAAGERPRVMAMLSRSTPLLLAAIGGVGAVAVGASIVMRHAGFAGLFQSLIVLVALEHFYLDGLFWAFRDPAVRKSMGPYLGSYAAPEAA